MSTPGQLVATPGGQLNIVPPSAGCSLSIRPAFESVNICKPKPEGLPAQWKMHGRIIVPSEMVPDRTRLRRMPYKNGKKVAMRIVVDISVSGPLNMKLWKAMKLPPGWRRGPRRSWKNECGFPVRIYTYEPRSLSQEELEHIQAYVALMESTA